MTKEKDGSEKKDLQIGLSSSPYLRVMYLSFSFSEKI